MPPAEAPTPQEPLPPLPEDALGPPADFHRWAGQELERRLARGEDVDLARYRAAVELVLARLLGEAP